jgi:MutS domain V
MFNIPPLQWLAGVLTGVLKPECAETLSGHPPPGTSGAADTIETGKHSRSQVVSSYSARIAHLQQQHLQAVIQRRRSSEYIAASVICTAAFLYLCFSLHSLPVWAAALPVIAAIVALTYARKCNRQTRDYLKLLDSYRRRIQCIQQEWMGNGDPGVDLKSPNHLSAYDLDLFGEGSLFELLCDVGSPAGRDALAQWLQNPCSRAEAISRQEAIRSLTFRSSLREKLALARSGEANEYSWDRLRGWFVAVPVYFPIWAPGLLRLLSTLMVLSAAAGFVHLMSAGEVLWVIALAGLPEGVLALFLHHRVQSVLEGLYLSSRQLESLRQLCSLFESECLESPLLTHMKQTLQGASKLISRLQRLVAKRELRYNEWFCWPAIFLAWNSQCSMQIERWRQQHGHTLVQLLNVLGEFEALMALAAYAYENPEDSYPELVEEGPRFEATGLGHPLMDVRSCVRNDLKLGGEVRFLLVTGSNMSGKSTLLRATGLNATLAWMGAPVRASHLRLSPLKVCASIRINDSLMSGRSHFLAEVERLKATLDCAASPTPVLFLIDELFSGTNSADRRVAAEAVIRLLVQRRAIGMVTSHDLSLAEIAENRESRGLNVHFAHLSSAEGLVFDYHLQPGKVEQSNALKIIRMIGIPIN